MRDVSGVATRAFKVLGMLFSDISPTPLKAVLKVMGYGAENFRLLLFRQMRWLEKI